MRVCHPISCVPVPIRLYMAEQAGELLVSDQGRQLAFALLGYFRVRRHLELSGRFTPGVDVSAAPGAHRVR